MRAQPFVRRLVGLACTGALAASAQAGVVGFNDPAAFDLGDLTQVRYTEGAYTLSYDATAGSAVALADLGDAGSGALVLLDGSVLTLSRTDGGLIALNDLLFGLSPLDASGASSPVLQLFGQVGGVDSLMADLALGAGLSFQPFAASWTGLSALRFATSGDAVLDNIRLSDLQAVPEPASAALLLAALLGAGLARRLVVGGRVVAAQAATDSVR